MSENVFNAETQSGKGDEGIFPGDSVSLPLGVSALEAPVNDTFGDILLFALVAGIDLAMGQPRMRHPNEIIDMQIEAVIERWHSEIEGERRLFADEIPGWLLSLPRQVHDE